MNTSNTSITIPTSEPDCRFFNFVVWGCIVTFLCLLGYLGNLLSFFALQRDSRTPAVTLLQSLAVSDVILLASVNLTDAIPYVCDYTEKCANLWRTWPYVRYPWLLTPVGHMCSIWLVVLVAANRFWAVCRPHTSAEVWSNGRTFIYVIVVVLLALLFNVPRLFEYEIVEVREPSQVVNFDLSIVPNDNTTHLADSPHLHGNASHLYHFPEVMKTVKKERLTSFGSSPLHKVGYKVVVVNILLVIFPLLFIFVTSVWIIRSLRNSEKIRAGKGQVPPKRGSVQEGRSESSRGSHSREVTFLLVAVVLVAVACQTPLAVFHFVRYMFKYRCGDLVFFLESGSKLLVTLNSCVNFIVYCVLSPRFRRLLRQLITCDGRHQSRRHPQQVDQKLPRKEDLPLCANKQESPDDAGEDATLITTNQ